MEGFLKGSARRAEKKPTAAAAVAPSGNFQAAGRAISREIYIAGAGVERERERESRTSRIRRKNWKSSVYVYTMQRRSLRGISYLSGEIVWWS